MNKNDFFLVYSQLVNTTVNKVKWNKTSRGDEDGITKIYVQVEKKTPVRQMNGSSLTMGIKGWDRSQSQSEAEHQKSWRLWTGAVLRPCIPREASTASSSRNSSKLGAGRKDCLYLLTEQLHQVPVKHHWSLVSPASECKFGWRTKWPTNNSY